MESLIDTEGEIITSRTYVLAIVRRDYYFFSSVGEFDELDYEEIADAYKSILRQEYFDGVLDLHTVRD